MESHGPVDGGVATGGLFPERGCSMRSFFASLLLAMVAMTPPTVRRVGTATLENVPEIPAEISAAVQRYQNFRAASFQDWLGDGSILIATRFGATQQIHRVAAPGADRTQLTFDAEPVARAVAVPGTTRFVMATDRGGDEWFQLYLVEGSDEPLPLTEAGTRNSPPIFSRDGKLLAWARSVKGSSEYTLLVADATDPRRARPLHRDSVQLQPSDISEDRTRLLCTRNISSRESQILLVDLATGKVAEVAAGTPALFVAPRFAAGGRSLNVISDRESDSLRLLQIDLASGRSTVLTPDLKWDVEAYDVSDDGRVLAYSVNEEGFSRLVLRDLVTRRALPQPALVPGVLQNLGFSPDGSKLAFDLSTATSASDVWSWGVAGGELTRWTRSELGTLDPRTLVEPELVRFPSFDGLSISAFVYRPAGLSPEKRTPVIVDIHGGPELQGKPSWNPGAQYFAHTLGATVILPNVRGSSGYGRRFRDLDNTVKREDSVQDIGALLDWIGTQPGLDRDRVAVYGQSYGGYMSLAVMTHYSERLVGGVERFGISDFVSFLENTEAYRRDNRRAEYGDERDPTMLATFRRISPLANVAKIRKPMLVMQGANDPRVPKSESDRVVAGIRANGVPVWYVVFADEGHGFQKKPNNDLRREVETLFLQGLFARDLGQEP